MTYMKISMKTQKFLFFLIQNLKTKVKLKSDVAIIFEITNVAKQVILVERLASFVCYTEKALLQHLGLDTYSDLRQVLNYGCVSIRFPLRKHKYLLLRSITSWFLFWDLPFWHIYLFFVHYLTIFCNFYCKYSHCFRVISPEENICLNAFASFLQYHSAF